MNPRAGSGQQLVCHRSRFPADAQRAGCVHLPVVIEEGLPVLRQRRGGKAEEPGQRLALSEILFAIGCGERTQRALVSSHCAFDERGKNPAQSVDLVGLVMRAALPSSCVFRELASNARVQHIEMARSGHGLIERAEDHGEDDAKGVVEAADGPLQQARVLSQRSRHPGVRQLQQRRPSRTQKQCRLAIDPPAHRLRAENSSARIGHGHGDSGEKRLAVAGRDVRPVKRSYGRSHMGRTTPKWHEFARYLNAKIIR